MQALVSFVQDDRDNLRSIVSGQHRFVFVCRGPLVLVSVAQSRQSETQVRVVGVADHGGRGRLVMGITIDGCGRWRVWQIVVIWQVVVGVAGGYRTHRDVQC